MELDQLEAFVTIVRSGGFTRASAALHLSQPAISRRLGLLERELGAPLFERLRRGVVLTDAGRVLLPHAEATLACVRDGIDAVGALRGTSQGTVTLAIVGTLASTTLTERLRRFREKHPGVDLRLQTALSAEVSALVLRGDAAVGLRYRTDPHRDLVSSTVYQEPIVPVCSSSHHLAQLRRVAPRALAGERWIGFVNQPGAASEPYSLALEQLRAAGGLAGSEIVPVDSLTAQKRLVEAGFGLALLPESSIDEELRSGTLSALRIPALRATIPVALIHRRRAFHNGATQGLIALLSAWPKRARRPAQPPAAQPRAAQPRPAAR
jgi:DNA-binding transcriptional LysR family regulator